MSHWKQIILKDHLFIEERRNNPPWSQRIGWFLCRPCFPSDLRFLNIIHTQSVPAKSCHNQKHHPIWVWELPKETAFSWHFARDTSELSSTKTFHFTFSRHPFDTFNDSFSLSHMRLLQNYFRRASTNSLNSSARPAVSNSFCSSPSVEYSLTSNAWNLCCTRKTSWICLLPCQNVIINSKLLF